MHSCNQTKFESQNTVRSYNLTIFSQRKIRIVILKDDHLYWRKILWKSFQDAIIFTYKLSFQKTDDSSFYCLLYFFSIARLCNNMNFLGFLSWIIFIHLPTPVYFNCVLNVNVGFAIIKQQKCLKTFCVLLGFDISLCLTSGENLVINAEKMLVLHFLSFRLFSFVNLAAAIQF